MIDESREKLKAVWRQSHIPVLYRKGKGEKLKVKLPYSIENGDWLQDGRRSIPHWNYQYECWEIPKSWFNDLVDRTLSKYGRLYIIQPYREQEKCAPACWNATGHECQCSCMGANHGSQSPSGDWFIASDTFATQWGDIKLACRLMTSQDKEMHS